MDFNQLFDLLIEYLRGDHSYYVYFLMMILCGLGVPLNADLLMLFAGSLAGIGILNEYYLIPITLLGLSIGDGLTHTIGRTVGTKVLRVFPFSRLIPARRVHRAYKFFKRYGAKMVFFARFLPGVRYVTNLSSGIFKIKFSHFLIMNFLGLLILSPSLILIGKFFISNLMEAQDKVWQILGSMIVVASALFFGTKKIISVQMKKLDPMQ
jgi:membrane protein DedA with SNARE-associated domain